MKKSYPNLKTERLCLREILISDLDRVHFFRSDKEINKFIKRPPQTIEMTIEHLQNISKEFIANKSVSWGITTKDSDILIGSICLWNFSVDRKTAEVGYGLDPAFQNKGIMGEALKEVLNFGIVECGFKCILAYTDYRNIPSKALLKQHGFIPITNIKDADNQDNEVFYLNC